MQENKDAQEHSDGITEDKVAPNGKKDDVDYGLSCVGNSCPELLVVRTVSLDIINQLSLAYALIGFEANFEYLLEDFDHRKSFDVVP